MFREKKIERLQQMIITQIGIIEQVKSGTILVSKETKSDLYSQLSRMIQEQAKVVKEFGFAQEAHKTSV